MPASETTSPTLARLAALCDESGLTRTEIAKRAKMAPSNLYRLLSGERNPALSTVERVARAAGGELRIVDADVDADDPPA